MELDSRKTAILQAVIKTYLETGEPVGSRTISKTDGLNLSSATIRNEMADLEEMGYLIQPHTSAGRIPSDKAYRLYVDTMMQAQTSEIEEARASLLEKSDRLESLLQQVANLLAKNTQYTTLVTTPKYDERKFKFIQLSELDEAHILLVVVLDNNSVKNRIIDLDEPVSKSSVLRINILINTSLAGLDIENVNLKVIAKLKEQAGEYVNLVNTILDAIGSMVSEQDDVRMYTSGATNILKYPELDEDGSMEKLLCAIEDKKQLKNLLTERMDNDLNEDTGIRVYIGDDTNVETLKNCSVVTATYEIKEGIYGKVGIVGPKRMDYGKVVGALKSLMSELDDIFKHKDDGRGSTRAIKLIDMKNDSIVDERDLTDYPEKGGL